ncbi:kinesin-like protein KIN-6 isoform X2 [Daucus carota subsp. sativus]|uniref:kinesin-like protein KIN-6 isoform X2 n=1 Tax=Daucus carota subsp. sativus TaxID=79200 RepID=UPI0007EFFE14|nr:PREDICTED: kinesin-like protein KIN-6 isoform X2 [Daucus carota subsp. sativus]
MAELKSPPSHPPTTVTVRRNPPRRARPTPSQAPIPISLLSTPSTSSKTVPSFPIDDILAIDVPKTELESENLKVFLRIRPQSIPQAPNKKGGVSKNVWPQSKQTVKSKIKKTIEVCLKENDEHSVTLCPPQSMQDQKRTKTEVYEGFSHVFSADSSQDDVFDKMVNPIVEDFIKGKSGMLAALGPSGSGKTHTIFGTARQPGMIPLALRRIFSATEEHGAQSSRTFYLSMFEICSERGRTERMIDLFNDGVDICLQQSTIKGLHESTICDVQQAEALIAQGMLKRATAMTNSNSQSSRSQCIINIRCETCGDVNASSNSALLTIVDLAGAEREKKTGNQGHRLLESNFINNTSMVFGLCLRSLLEHQKNRKKPMQKHFKNSLLTRYLRDYLEGKKRMALILTVKSGEEDYLDASFLLRQASPFMKIKFTNSEESTELIGNKRQYQPFLKADQQKKMKMSTIDSSAANEKSSDVVNSTPHEKEPQKVITMKKVNEVDDTTFLAKSPETFKSKVGESTFVNDNINAATKNRLTQTMQGFAIAAWQVLKQYKGKLKVAEKEICCLKQSLTEEKARSEKLAMELAHIKSSFLCEKIVSTDKIETKKEVCRENGLDESAESDYQSVDTHELRSFGVVSTSCVDRKGLEEQNCQVAGVSSVNLSESEVIVNNQNTDSTVINSCVVSTSCIGEEIQHVKFDVASEDVEISKEKEDSNCKGIMLLDDSASCLPLSISDNFSSSIERPQSKNDTEKEAGASSVRISESEFTENHQITDSSGKGFSVHTSTVSKEIFGGQCRERAESSGVAENLEILESKNDSDQNVTDNLLLEDSANSVQPIVSISDDSSPLVNEHHLQTGRQKKMLDETTISTNVPEIAVKVLPSPKPPTADKPKRRLQPASSMLLKNLTGLDIGDEDEKPKGARGSKRNTGLDLTRKTQGSLSLLRLLKNNV